MTKRPQVNALHSVKAVMGQPVANPPDLAALAGTTQTTVLAGRQAAGGGGQANRIGKVNISGFFDPAWKRGMRLVQAKTDLTLQQLLEEAMTDLFRKHNVPVPATAKEINQINN